MDDQATPRGAVAAALFATVAAPFAAPGLLGNESDVLAIARQFAQPDWIPHDWYLQLPGGYRALFNVLFRALLESPLQTSSAILIGRLLVAALLAAALASLLALLECPWYLGVPGIWLYLRHSSLGAGEWIVGGLETKPFAYALAILGMVSFARRRWTAAFAQLGLAASFHMLVGAHALTCVLFAAATDRNQLRPHLRALLRRLWLLPLCAAFAICAALRQRVAARALSPAELERASAIYVRFRVAHHLMPSEFAGHWALALTLCIAFFALTVSSTRGAQRFIAAVGLGSTLLFVIGLILSLTGPIGALKLYWFRFPDTMAPLLSGVLAGSRLSAWLERLCARDARWLRLAAAALALALVLQRGYRAARGLASSLPLSDEEFFATGVDPQLAAALHWIRHETAADSRFLIPPSLEAFYFLAQRPSFVSFKHFPQLEADTIEWRRRIGVLCSEHLPDARGLKAQPELDASYAGLTSPQLHALAMREHIDYMLTARRSDLADQTPVYENGGYTIYRLGAAQPH